MSDTQSFAGIVIEFKLFVIIEDRKIGSIRNISVIKLFKVINKNLK